MTRKDFGRHALQTTPGRGGGRAVAGGGGEVRGGLGLGDIINTVIGYDYNNIPSIYTWGYYYHYYYY